MGGGEARRGNKIEYPENNCDFALISKREEAVDCFGFGRGRKEK